MSHSRFGSLQILHLLAKLLDHVLHFEAGIGQFEIVRFGAAGIDLAVELLRQEIEPPSDRSALADQVAGVLAGKIDAVAPSIDGLLALKGVIELVEPESNEAEDKAAKVAAGAAFDQALLDLVEMRQREGVTLGQILSQRMEEIERLARKAEAAPGRKPDAIRARLAEQIAALLETSDRFDPDRLNQEALLIAAKADIREELDRIASHVSQARDLISKGGPVGRRLDFLAQEFNREVNTCCSKSNDLELTNTGIEMKNVVEQFREQVQNLE